MGTISAEAFHRSAEDLVEKSANLDREYQWHVKKHKDGQFFSNSSVVVINGETIVRTFHITYSESYQVPILWFNFSRQTGALLTLEEILNVIPADKRKVLLADSLISISQREHPFFNVLFYHIHPCKTASVMKDVHYNNYVISWLSIFGTLLQLLPISKELFMKS